MNPRELNRREFLIASALTSAGFIAGAMWPKNAHAAPKEGGELPDSPFFIHTVQFGDTVPEIARMYGVPIESINKALGVSQESSQKIWPGKRLIINEKPTHAPYVGLEIPGVSNIFGGDRLPIQPLWLESGNNNQLEWSQPNDAGAWMHAGFGPRTGIYFHRDTLLGRHLSSLATGQELILYRQLAAAGNPDNPYTDGVSMKVISQSIIDASNDRPEFLSGKISRGRAAIVSCHPLGDPSAPQRLITWVKS